MCEDIQRPLGDQMDAMMASSKTGHSKSGTATKGGLLQGGDSGDAEGGEEEGANETGGKKEPEWVGQFDTNAMASMMQDTNMQQLLSQLTQTMPGPTKKLHPDDPFLDPGFIGQMFHAQTVNSMTMLQQAVEQLSMTADFAAGP